MDIEESREILKRYTEDNVCIEFNDLRQAIKTMLIELQEKTDEVKMYQVNMKLATDQLKAKLDKKEAVINEMAKYLDAEDATETFCEGQKEADCIADCINCIKEYFTNKVEQK